MEGPVLVTGPVGFVGRHLLAALGPDGVATEVDVTDPITMATAVRSARPRAVVHLAAHASGASSWSDQTEVWRVNTLGTVVLLAAVAEEAPSARVLLASTGEVYGRANEIPTPESAPLRPLSPYAASKAAAELAAERARRVDGLDVVVARAFPHAGPGQDARFAIGSWTEQLARLDAEGGTLTVGDLSVRRDLLDVRDVCRAYLALLDPAVPAETYNVATRAPVELRAVVETLVELTGVPVTVEQDPARLRPADLPELSGDPRKLIAATGWRPEIELSTTLVDALDEARRGLRAETPA
jgi:GDP-4-dehydro-6-deoxy-D-mannose reductase